MTNSFWWRFFTRRSAVCFFVILLLFFSGFLRVAVIAMSDNTLESSTQGRYNLKIASQRGTIYDCNMMPITNNKSKIVACITPTQRAKTAISSCLEGEELEKLLSELENDKPVLCELPTVIECDDIYYTTIHYTDNESFATHTVGYVNKDNVGVTGLQAAYNDYLKSENEAYFSFYCDAVGNIFKGVSPEIINNTSVTANGVVSTIDINVQNIIEETSNSLTKGAIVVADAKTLKIRGIVSRPNFNPENLSDYLNDDASPLFNRAINNYAIGSAFKPCIAAAALENSKGNVSYTCSGKMQILDRVFNCHNHSGHGNLTLEYALANSCNTYFFNLAILNGKDKIYDTALTLNFGKKIKLCNRIYTAESSIPQKTKLENTAHLANFSIGQGDLSASPVAMLTLYSAIANGGKYYMPSLIEGTYKNGAFTKYDIGYPTRAMSIETADTLKKYLFTVVDEGTGQSAMPKTVTAAGKTATAQTGIFENSKEINRSWFCGFFPAENPKYVIIIFGENSMIQTKSCAEIFAETADKIASLIG